jgi:transcriptional regulator with XRE-family HTH domain
MEFNEKLQELRKQKGLTQEELAEALYVSRAAVSKWESGRGYPNIDSLKEISRFFSVTIDDLLSGSEILTIAEEDQKQKNSLLLDLVFGLLDLSVSMFLFLPLFGQREHDTVYEVSLLALSNIAPYLMGAYIAIIAGMILWGILTLALQNCNGKFWVNYKRRISFLLGGSGTLLFIVSMQPYAAALLFIFLSIKILIFVKKQ